MRVYFKGYDEEYSDVLLSSFDHICSTSGLGAILKSHDSFKVPKALDIKEIGDITLTAGGLCKVSINWNTLISRLPIKSFSISFYIDNDKHAICTQELLIRFSSEALDGWTSVWSHKVTTVYASMKFEFKFEKEKFTFLEALKKGNLFAALTACSIAGAGTASALIKVNEELLLPRSTPSVTSVSRTSLKPPPPYSSDQTSSK